MRILGLDVATVKTGWALLDDGELGESGVISIEESWKLPRRLSALHELAHEIIVRTYPDVVVLEDVHGQRFKVAFALGQARGAVLVAAQHANIRIGLVDYTAKQIKKCVAGTGSASKQMVADALVSHFGGHLRFEDDNESDAIAIALTHEVQERAKTK